MQPKPKVGDIWRSDFPYYHWLVVERYLDKDKNTHMLTLQSIEKAHLYTTTAVSVRNNWEYVS